ncbi:MAG TPA: hypothetical protein VM370_03550 [Candidatus Thermoplasmatota archaeon]|nr:hypothetical protein [Candidatus Thermoplasmatota archaeon]
MDEAHEVRADLRSYALRRCIRFYSAILVTSVAWTVSRIPSGQARSEAMLGGAFLLSVLVVVELGAMWVMVDMARARARLGEGPETRLWAFSQGPWPSLLAAALFTALSLAFFFLA